MGKTRDKTIYRCGHIVLKEIQIGEDATGIYKKAVCSSCKAVVILRYNLLTISVYDTKGKELYRY